MPKIKTFTLYTTPISANGRKVLAVAKQLELSPNIKEVNVYKGQGQTPEYLAINPFGKIPTLVDNDFVLWESNAIMQYISDVYGDYQLSSNEPKVRADIDRWLFWESSHWQPAISEVLTETVGHQLLPELLPKPTSSPNWEEKSFKPLASFLNSHLEDRRFICGNKLSIADFSIAGMMTYFRFGQFPFERFPYIDTWYKGIEELDAWKSNESELWAVHDIL